MKPLAGHGTHWLVTAGPYTHCSQSSNSSRNSSRTTVLNWSRYNSMSVTFSTSSMAQHPGHLITTEDSPAPPTPPTCPNQPFHPNLCYQHRLLTGKPSTSWENRYIGKLMKQWKPSLQSPQGSTRLMNNTPTYTLNWRIRLVSWYHNPL